jgi:hypothetical protein
MKHKEAIVYTTVFCLFFLAATLPAQQLNSIPIGHDAYTVIDNGVLRGLIEAPPSAKPWSGFTVQQKLREILDADSSLLNDKERKIVTELLRSFNRTPGLDLRAGKYHSETTLRNGSRFSFDAGINWESSLSVNVNPRAFGTVNLGTLNIAGDMGDHFSWDFNLRGGFFSIDRVKLGERTNPPYTDPKYGKYEDYDPLTHSNTSSGHTYYYDVGTPQTSSVYAIPSYFPYTFTKSWEGGVFPPARLNSYNGWPDTFAFGYEVISEINAGLFDNRMQFRFGRMRRDWGPEATGASLFMNAQARPFLAIEGTVIPTSWMHFSFLTGVLEYMNEDSQWWDAEPFQNLFSLALLEFNPSKYFHFDFGSATVWPKRLELGYLFPVNSNFFYQNNVGDFDNLGLFADIEGRLPGIGKIWASFYADELNFMHKPFFHLDREMYAWQAGLQAYLPVLPLASVSLRYTKVEPYAYTHEYTETPWNRLPSDTAYLNNGESLGSYLPPNSDELSLRLESMLLPGTKAHLEYQMIRHGVDFGPGRVDGSSLRDKIVKDDNTSKYFLKDGVYQWNHVIKAGGTYSLKSLNIPVSVFAETGVVLTRYTAEGRPELQKDNSNPLDYSGYKDSAGFILSIGFKVYP